MPEDKSLIEQLRSLDSYILSLNEHKVYSKSLIQNIQSLYRMVNQQDREAWSKITTKEEWEEFLNPRIEALKQSLGTLSPAPEKLNVHITGTIEGDGYKIENLVYESRAGLYVTANLYTPPSSKGRIPAIVIVHSHHNPKTQDELQDMGMTWARSGCMVLVMDQLGYGERREHQPGSRQDYRYRYINGIKLYIIGDSLMGWMVWDVMRGMDLLLDRDDVDDEKIILIGAVAGGGDPAAVTAAIDKRVKCVIPFNFGGPQPETQHPLPEDAEETFNYMGEGSWESTRNLRLSGRDGFLPWVIVASVAPRYLIYAHEFSWDKDRDPVWKRLQKVFGFYDAADHLAFTHGSGVLSGKPPEATHCNNVGVVHRKMIHSALERWFGIPIPQEYQNRLPENKLMCLNKNFLVKSFYKTIYNIGISRSNTFRESIAELPITEKRTRLRQKWAKLLGNIDPKSDPVVQTNTYQILDGIHIERILLEVETGIVIPVLGMRKYFANTEKFPAVVGISREGKKGFLKERAVEISELIEKGFIVFLPDVRNTGETRFSSSSGRQSEATYISAAELMLGQTVLGSQLRDLRSVIRYLNARTDVRSEILTVWGDSFAPVNSPGLKDPLMDEDPSPHQSEPSGGILALLIALYEENIGSVIARGMMAGYQSILDNLFCYVPYDVVIPGVLTTGDLCDIISVLAPKPLRLEFLVDGRNCPVTTQKIKRFFEPMKL